MMKLRHWLPVVLIAAAAGAYVLDLKPGGVGVSNEGQRQFTICRSQQQRHCVVDGDTMRYAGDIIRLKDIDTPEISGAKCDSERDLGERAKYRLLDLLNSGQMEVVHDGGRDEDQYGRKLRIIEIDGRSVGETLIAEGLARPWGGRRRSWCG